MALSTGKILNNRYRIVKLLGLGGFGAVYRAWDLHLEKPYAIKENLETKPEAQRQFEREAKILARLHHPNLPSVTDHFIENQRQYLVMDFVEGEDLEQLQLGLAAPLPEAQVVPWIEQICDALDYLHSQNPPIIHRDIKPANIKITPEGKAMLVDFGIAKEYDPHLKTTVGAQAVTPGFSPFEQYGRGTTDARTDIYALGATLYNLLTGKEPPESIQRINQDSLVPPSRYNLKISSHVESTIMQALAIHPTGRYQKANEFSSALRQSTAVKPPSVSSPVQTASSAPAPASGVAPISQRWWWSVALSFILIFIGWIVWSGSDGEGSATLTPVSGAMPVGEPSQPVAVSTTEVPGQIPTIGQKPTRTPTRTRTPTNVPKTPTPTVVEVMHGFDLAFASDRGGGFSIYLVNLQTENTVSLPRPSGYEVAWWPWFCGDQIATEVHDTNGSNPQWIYMLGLDGDTSTKWNPPGSPNHLGVPRCSTDAKYMAYSADESGSWKLYVADIAGHQASLFDDNPLSGYVSWSADNYDFLSMSKIDQFVIRKTEDMNSGSTKTIAQGKYPVLSPNGKYMAYICGTNLDLCVKEFSTGKSTTLYSIKYERINDVRVPASPAWSADGEWIYFASADDGDWDIYRIRPDGDDIQNLTQNWDSSNELMPASR
jgi:serine/threonine protein kinase